MPDTLLRARKLAARDERQIARAHRRTLRRHYRRCFWTWPFGHRYADGRECVGCHKPVKAA